MVKYRKISIETSISLRIEHQRYGRSSRALAAEYGLPQRTVMNHAVKPIPTTHVPPPVDNRKNNPGRPKKIDDRGVRTITRSIKYLRTAEGLSFTADDIRRRANLLCASRRTVARYLNKIGYKKRQLRRKGQLTEKDRRRRYQYALYQRRNSPDDAWKGIAMYLDGVSFVHKTNPAMCARYHANVGYRTRQEGLKITGKGAKEGVAGKTATFMVGISYGKGVVMCRQWFGKWKGANWAPYVEQEFPEVFERIGKGNKFVQDGDPIQNSKIVREALSRIDLDIVSIPARSPDLNPIENMFNLIRQELHQQAKDKNIVRETFAQFSQRVNTTLLRFPPALIDSTIASIPKRLRAIISSKGHRTKY